MYLVSTYLHIYATMYLAGCISGWMCACVYGWYLGAVRTYVGACVRMCAHVLYLQVRVFLRVYTRTTSMAPTPLYFHEVTYYFADPAVEVTKSAAWQHETVQTHTSLYSLYMISSNQQVETQESGTNWQSVCTPTCKESAGSARVPTFEQPEQQTNIILMTIALLSLL